MEIGGEGNKTIGKHIAIKSIEKSHGYQVATIVKLIFLIGCKVTALRLLDNFSR
jgi:hypothetical protein